MADRLRGSDFLMFDASPEVFYEQPVASTWQASIEAAPGRQTLGTPAKRRREADRAGRPRCASAFRPQRGSLDHGARRLPRATYAYNGDGLRMAKTVGATPTSFVWDDSAELPLPVAEGSDYYVYGPDASPIERISISGSTSTPTWFHKDQLGSVRVLTDASGAMTGTASFDAYGRRTDGTTTTPMVAGERVAHLGAGEHVRLGTGHLGGGAPGSASWLRRPEASSPG